MSLNGIIETATQGMDAQTTRLSAIAANVANIDTPGYAPASISMSSTPQGGVQANVSTAQAGTQVDETSEITSMAEASASFEMNASVFETGADLWQVLATIRQANEPQSN